MIYAISISTASPIIYFYDIHVIVWFPVL
jgi:hypothetical protein